MEPRSKQDETPGQKQGQDQTQAQPTQEGNREGFRVEHLREAQRRSWEALAEIQKRIRPGMTEDEARKLGEVILRERGATKNWHRVVARFGVNTLKRFSEPSEPGVVLGESDVYYLDLGPVWEIDGLGYEGDVGDTFTVGADPEHVQCAESVRELFRRVKSIWSEERISGPELYARAEVEAERLGVILNREVDGHRVGDFPHQLFFRGGLTEIDFTPSAGAWILEIQVRHPSRPFGAFFEDLL
jgi:Xaa-Pro aminopeptidase